MSLKETNFLRDFSQRMNTWMQWNAYRHWPLIGVIKTKFFDRSFLKSGMRPAVTAILTTVKLNATGYNQFTACWAPCNEGCLPWTQRFEINGTHIFVNLT